MTRTAIAARPQIPIRLDRMKRSPALNIIGAPELIGLACAALLALLTIFAYFYFYLPARSRLVSTELDLTRLRAQRLASGTALEQGLTTKQTVDKIQASLEDFETNWLPAPGSGRMSLYNVLNNLIKSNGLRNTAGPSYSPLEALGTKQQIQLGLTAQGQSNAKWQTIYPGIAVSVTVEGPYQNIRHFVRDIETSRQFLIINAIELEQVTQSSAAQEPPAAASVQPAARRTNSTKPNTISAGNRSTLVSLRMDMATYFQRPESNTKNP